MRSFLFLFVFSPVAIADDFPELFNTEPISAQEQMPAPEAAKKMKLPPGFRANVFAAEPDVQNPIAMAWDTRGRMWIAENYTYAERSQRFQLDLRDRVIILDNTTGDQFKTRKIFSDNLTMLTGIEVGHGGVWLMCPPKLIFIPDEDGDDVPDNAGEVVLDGFTVAQQNYHNFANGLRFGPDGWLYGRCGGSCPGRIGRPGTPDHHRLALEGGIWRYHPKHQQVEVLTSGTTNPWGHDWNEVGELFFTNTVNGHLWHVTPGAHFTRPFLLDPNRRTYRLIDFHADHWHFDTGQSWTASRDGAANSFGGGHAHSGAMIYQGDNWPSRYRGNLFTLNFHGRRANQEILHREGSGYLASHGEDFFLAADEWFRGMDLSTGPDGTVFVLDWSDAGECHEHTGVHRTSGRIYKIEYAPDNESENSEEVRPDIRQLPDRALGALHAHDNQWYVRQARLELARRAANGNELKSANEALRALFAYGNDKSRLLVQSLLSLHITGGIDDSFLRKQVAHRNEYVRAWAIRLLTEQMPLDDTLGPVWVSMDDDARRDVAVERLLPLLIETAATDRSALVRRTLASTLQRLPVKARPALAKALVGHAEDASDHNLPLMIWYGLIPVADENPNQLAAVAKACRMPVTLEQITRCLTEEIENHPDAINTVIAHAVDQDEILQASVLNGLAQGLKGWRQAKQPNAWSQLAANAPAQSAAIIRELSVVFGDGRAMDELRKIVVSGKKVESSVRLAALQTLIDQEPDDLREICQSLLRDQHMNVLAARGLSQFDDPKVGEAIVARYRNFRGPFRPQVISILVSRASFAEQLLEAIDAGKIPRQDLSAYQVRQIHSLGSDSLSKMVSDVWGDVRETSAEKKQVIETLKEKLTSEFLTHANLGKGRALYAKTCQNCHRLYGEGEVVGPDLTGSDRGNLDYLLGNIVDPSAVVDKKYRMSILLTDDDRIINGLVIDETDRAITIQTATEKLTFPSDLIVSRKMTEKSPMPDGLLDTLTLEQIRDLIAYLRHPSQVDLASLPDDIR
ncbi:MAG: PVC-type heme-binding CxxCH protein [Planctomycetota bacterium]